MQTWAQVLTRTRGGCVVHRCQNKNPRTRKCEWRHALEACAEDLGGFEKSELSWALRSEEEGWLSLARSGLVSGAQRVGGGANEKASIERLGLSLSYVETFNSKVIRGFVAELRSRYVFFVFRDSYVLCIYMLWTFYVHFTYSWMALLQVLRGSLWLGLIVSFRILSLVQIELFNLWRGIIISIKKNCK